MQDILPYMVRSFQLDDIDRSLLAALLRDAGLSYARLGETVGLAAASAHDRVRKLREHGVITGSTITIDPSRVGRDVLAFVTLTADAWVGDPGTREAIAAIPEVEGAYVVAGNASLMVKVRATTNAHLQQVLRRLYDIDGIAGTESTVVLETFFERSTDLSAEGT
jgi:DNA-binding Lrp family transcriptional regulator